MQMLRMTLSTCFVQELLSNSFPKYIFWFSFYFWPFWGWFHIFLCFFYFSLNSTWFSLLVQVIGTGTEVLTCCPSLIEHLNMFWLMNPKYSIWSTWFLCIWTHVKFFIPFLSFTGVLKLCIKTPVMILFMF